MSNPSRTPMPPAVCYSAREIAQAAGVSEGQVLTALARLGGTKRYVSHEDAVTIGRALHQSQPARGARPETAGLFSVFSNGRGERRANGLPLALSSTLHVGVFA